MSTMLQYLSSLTESFYRHRHYLPLPTNTPRGSVSSQGGDSTPSGDPPSSPIALSSSKGFVNKGRSRRKLLSWYLRLLVVLTALTYALLPTLRRFFFPSIGISDESRAEAINLLVQQLETSAFQPEFSSSFNSDNDDSKSARIPAAESLHRLFREKLPEVASRGVMPIQAYDALSDACIEEWIVHHKWGNACQGTDLSKGLKFEAVWAWVNGSDPAQILARNAYRPSSPINVDAAHRYADHNELLYSMRSLYQSFGSDSVSKMHILASAYPIPDRAVAELGPRQGYSSSSGNEQIMAGQVPYWLNASFDGDKSKIDLHHDADYFRPMQLASSDREMTSKEVKAWHAQTIPSFNSLAVESQLFNLPRASSDQLVYLNDDFFTMVSNSVSDLTSPLFGPVIKSDTRLFSFYRPSEHPFQRLWNPAGEEVGIKRAAWILGQRFTTRSLPYITHHPRSLSLPLLKEAAQTFPEAFSNTTLARFRAQKEVPTSIQAFFLASWYIVERHREALLWSWAVAKWGGSDGWLSEDIKQAMWDELQLATNSTSEGIIDVRTPLRKSREEDSQAFHKANVPAPKNTQYSFSSQDGYALSFLDWSWPWQLSRNGYPDLSKGEGERTHARSWIASGIQSKPACQVSYAKCFAPQESGESADAFFKRIAFAPSTSSTCGDCIIAALLNASGRSGISAFLPSAETIVRIPSSSSNLGSRAHLPLTEKWRDTDFSLNFVLGPGNRNISLRTWCTRLIQRYQYVLGSTPSAFYKVEYASRLPKQLEAVEKTLATPEPTTFVCLNDDIKESEEGTKKLNVIMKEWFASHWSRKLPGEI